MKRRKWLLEIISGLLALLFIYTAASKLMDFKQFQKEINNQAFPKELDSLLIYGLPPSELISAGMLLIARFRIVGLWIYLVLMLLFTGYVSLVTFHFYDRVPCSCAGVFRLMGWPAHLVFNVATVLLTAWALSLAIKENRNQRLEITS
jgi:putative oxidoreductase